MSEQVPSNDRWPRVCMCNECGHFKEFASWDALVIEPVCDQCGAHAFDGDGYCWCDMCAKPAGMEGEARTLAQAADSAEGRTA